MSTTARRTRALAAVTARKPAPKTITPPAKIEDWPERYAMIASGTCMEPIIPDGAQAAFSTAEPYGAGDIVIVHFMPEFVPPGGLTCAVKRLVVAPPPRATMPYIEHPKSEVEAVVICVTVNDPRIVVYRLSKIRAIHKFIGLVTERGLRVSTSRRAGR